MKPKRIPLRKCTGCNEMKSKKELMRVVRDDEGRFSLDFTGKKAGRGAYVCPDNVCLQKALKNKGLERSFKTSVPKDVYAELERGLTEKDG